jgi:hypothetical protein
LEENIKYYCNCVCVKDSFFWHIAPYSPLEVKVSEEHVASIFRFEKKSKQESGIKQLATSSGSANCFILVPCLVHSSTLKLEATWSSETSVEITVSYLFHASLILRS